jgi:hypothetical protein
LSRINYAAAALAVQIGIATNTLERAKSNFSEKAGRNPNSIAPSPSLLEGSSAKGRFEHWQSEEAIESTTLNIFCLSTSIPEGEDGRRQGEGYGSTISEG